MRREVAANSGTPPATRRQLSVDPVAYVRRFAAEAGTGAWLRGRVRDSDPAVRAAAAGNRAASVAVLARAAVDVAELVRAAAAGNPSCPPLVLDVLARDRSDKVASEALMQDACSPETLSRAALSSRSLLQSVAAGHRRCHPEILARLGGHDEWAVRLYVARNPSTPTQTLSRLADDINTQVNEAARASLTERELQPAAR